MGRCIIHISEINEINQIYFQVIDYCDSVRRYYQAPIFMILTSDIFAIIYMILTAFHEFVSKSIPKWAVLFCVVDPFVRIVQIIVVISTAEIAVSQVRQKFVFHCKSGSSTALQTFTWYSLIPVSLVFLPPSCIIWLLIPWCAHFLPTFRRKLDIGIATAREWKPGDGSECSWLRSRGIRKLLYDHVSS